MSTKCAERTVSVVPDDDDLVFDVTGDHTHRVPNRCNFRIHYSVQVSIIWPFLRRRYPSLQLLSAP